MVTAEAFIEKVKIPLNENWGYIYGTWGTIWTQKKQNAATREMTIKYGSRWIGHMVTDCSGLLRWALYQLGETIVHHARYQYTDYCGPKGKLVNGHREDGNPVLPGTAVFLQGSEAHIHHVGVYVGNDVCIEAKGTIYGVVTSHLDHWDHWGELNMVDYANAAELETGESVTPEQPEDAQAGTVIKATVNNPNRWLNVRTGPGVIYPVAYQVEKGSTVDVLDAGEPDWWQIRYGGRIGWASAQYLVPVVMDEPDEPDEPEEPEESEEPIKADLSNVLAQLKSIRYTVDTLIESVEELMK